MADFLSSLQGIGGILQMFQGASITRAGAAAEASAIIQGGEVAAQGALLSAAGYRTQIQSVKDATAFNLKIQARNNVIQTQALSRQFQKAVSAQRVQMAASGVSSTSRSFLQIRNETADFFEDRIRDFKINAENVKRAELFKSQVEQTRLENQARAAEYQAAAERVLAANRAAQASYAGEVAAYKQTQGAFQELPNILGGLFS